MKRSGWRSLVAGLFIMCLGTSPAVAAVNGVGVFNGWWFVGDSFAYEECRQSGSAEPEGPGLPLMEYTSKVRTWSLHTAIDFLGTTGPVDNPSAGGYYPGQIFVCGWMDGPLPGGSGPSCLASKAYHGRGFLKAASQLTGEPFRVELYNVGWKVSAGNVAPLMANYRETETMSPYDKTAGTEGTLLGLIASYPSESSQILPNDVPCFWGPTFQTDFFMWGAVALMQEASDVGKYPYPGVHPEVDRHLWQMEKRCSPDTPADACGPGHEDEQ